MGDRQPHATVPCVALACAMFTLAVCCIADDTITRSRHNLDELVPEMEPHVADSMHAIMSEQEASLQSVCVLATLARPTPGA